MLSNAKSSDWSVARAIMTDSQDGLIVLNPTGIVEACNTAAAYWGRILFDSEVSPGADFRRWVLPSQHIAFDAALNQVCAGQRFEIDTRFVLANGTDVEFKTMLTPIVASNGTILGILHRAIHRSAQTHNETYISSRHAGFMAMLDLAATQLDGLLSVWNAEDRCVDVVIGSLEETWGIAPTVNPRDLFQAAAAVMEPAYRPVLLAAVAALPAPFDITVHINHARKGPRWLHIFTKPIQDAVPGLVVGLTRDVTADIARAESDREKQEYLRRADRIATLGSLNASLIHDLKQSLNGISLAVGLIDEWVAQLQPILQRTIQRKSDLLVSGCSLEEIHQQLPIITSGIQDSIRHMVGLHAQSKEYAIGAPVLIEKVSLDRLLADVVSQVRPYLDRSLARCVIDCDAALPAIWTQRIGIEQILVNLVTNAAQALLGLGGTITLSAAVTDPGVILTVMDDGPGIPLGDQHRLGVDFFTTRQDGSGLGWAIIRRVSNDLGGTVAIHSVPGNGTRVCCTLPLRLESRPSDVRTDTVPDRQVPQ